MAYWKNEIKVQVTLPYITQGGTLGNLYPEITITSEDIWFLDGYWKAYIAWGDYPILFYGKATRNGMTTHKVQAFCSCDGTSKGKEEYKVKVISYDQSKKNTDMTTINKVMAACNINEQQAINEVQAANDILLASDNIGYDDLEDYCFGLGLDMEDVFSNPEMLLM